MHSGYVLYGLCYNHYSLHLFLQPRTRTPHFFFVDLVSVLVLFLCVYTFAKTSSPYQVHMVLLNIEMGAGSGQLPPVSLHRPDTNMQL